LNSFSIPKFDPTAISIRRAGVAGVGSWHPQRGDPRAPGRKQPGPGTSEIWTTTAASLGRVEVNRCDVGMQRGPWLGRDEVWTITLGLCLLLWCRRPRVATTIVASSSSSPARARSGCSGGGGYRAHGGGRQWHGPGGVVV
jgi:hypothetical protein